MYKALFLDRDGILNHLVNNRPPWSLSEIKIFKEAYKIIYLSKSRSYIPIVISNQPDAGRGSLSYKILDLINRTIMNKLDIKHFYICTHPYDGMCNCRKPMAGSFYKAKEIHNINLKKSFMVGDREKDIFAGKKAECKTIYLSLSRCESADYNVKCHHDLIQLLEEILV